MGARHERRARGDLARAGASLSVPIWGTTPILVGDHIENVGNVDCLRAAAAMFEWPCGFIDDSDGIGVSDGAWRLHGDALAGAGVPIIAVENASGAEDLFKYRPPDGPFVVVVGNERKGVSRELLRLADRVVQIPIRSVQLNCLNVAAAAAVAAAAVRASRWRASMTPSSSAARSARRHASAGGTSSSPISTRSGSTPIA